jgi:DtxR family Mn-dependent transcriptional regulator
MNEQIAIQHTLKHLAEQEYDKRPVSRDELARDVGVSRVELDRVLADLAAADLIEGDSLALTRGGREYALHVLRAHRLYETYLARKTGVRDDQWHPRADIAEHTLSSAAVEQLSRELNYPRFDPHGDPIPSATGVMPPRRGQPVTDYPAGWEGRVVHVEDEPPPRYALIAAAGIAPGTVLRIEANDGQTFRVRAEGCAFAFSLDTARQIAVVPLMDGERFDDTLRRLASLATGEEAAIAGLSPLCRGLERNRLLDLGVVPGTVVRIDLVSPAGSPIAYRIRGASIALRRQQAERILIHHVKEAPHG